MKANTTFSIKNNSGNNMTIVHEPEGFEYELSPTQEIVIATNGGKDSIVIETLIDVGKIVLYIADNKSPYSVYCNGVNVFEKYFS
jgi:hypothetical protein